MNHLFFYSLNIREKIYGPFKKSNHLLAHLAPSGLPSIAEVTSSEYVILGVEHAISALSGECHPQNSLILFTQKISGGKYFIQMRGEKTNQNNTYHVSLQALFNMEVETLRTEFQALNLLANTRNFIYTVDPPRIFAGCATTAFMSRLKAVAFRYLAETEPALFSKMTAVIFNDFGDTDLEKGPNQGIIHLMRNALQPVLDSDASLRVQPRTACYDQATGLYQGYPGLSGQALLVIHNNSDAFGENIRTEGCSSLDGVIGTVTDGAITTDASMIYHALPVELQSRIAENPAIARKVYIAS